MMIIPNIQCHLIAKKMNNVLYEINQNHTEQLGHGEDYDLRSPLHIAAFSNNIEAAQFLLTQGNSYDSAQREKKSTALIDKGDLHSMRRS